MSDVGLPSRRAWATLEQEQRRSFPLQGRKGACRSLFGPVDHEELRRELEGQLRAMREESRRRWEYDFQEGRPARTAAAEGRFQWEEVDARTVPAFYREKEVVLVVEEPSEASQERRGAGGGVSGPPSPLSPRDQSPGGEAPKKAQEEEEGKERGGRSSYSGTLLKPSLKRAASPSLPRITDFFAKRKRVADLRVAVDPATAALPASVAALPPEQTPRKRLR